MDMSILLKIQTETRSVFETNKSHKERNKEKNSNQIYKRKFMDSILNRELVYNEEFKKIDVTERNTKIFACKVAQAKEKVGSMAQMFGTTS